jgi:four helix bundle protein
MRPAPSAVGRLRPFPYTFPLPMALDHERLEVYQVALELFDLIDDIVEHLPRGRGHLADQLSRAGLSVVNNIAEGAGKFSPGDKRRYYLIANGSTTESAAMLDVCLRRKLVSDDSHRRGKQLAERIVAMLTKLAKSHDRH